MAREPQGFGMQLRKSDEDFIAIVDTSECENDWVWEDDACQLTVDVYQRWIMIIENVKILAVSILFQEKIWQTMLHL